MMEDISRYQFIKSADEIPLTRIFKYAYPRHIRMYCRQDNTFFREKITLAIPFKAKNEDINKEQTIVDSVEEHFGLTRDEVYAAFLELFGGQQGYYVADLKSRNYFYSKNYDELEPLLIELGATVV